MTKKLFYFFTLICSIGVFTACDKDDDKGDNDWNELPQGEIKVEDSKLSLNGESATGTVKFTALSLSTAQMEVKDMIDGYSDVTVDLVMEKQSDGSFKLSGTKEITTKPVTKATSSPAPFLTVKVDGVITLAGKLTADFVISGPGLYLGTYSGKTLVLTYGDLVLTDKEVVYDGTDGSNVSLLLKDVIPGEPEAVLTGVQMSDKEFSGTATTNNATVKYTGSRANKVLTLKLEVTMKDPKGWAKTYKLADYTTGELTYNGFTNPNAVIAGAGYVNYVTATPDDGISYGVMFRSLFGALLPQVLKTVTLEADGNITAEYIKAPKIQFDPMWIFMSPTSDVVQALIPSSGWTKSVKNLAFWFEKDGKLYLKLNVASIVSQAMGVGSEGLGDIISQVLNGDAAMLKGLLEKMLQVDASGISDESINMLLSWVKDGVPMTVKTADGHTYMYLDKEAFDPLMKMRKMGDKETSDILTVWQMLSDAKIIPEEAAMASSIILGVCQKWSETEAFELGLDLQNAK